MTCNKLLIQKCELSGVGNLRVFVEQCHAHALRCLLLSVSAMSGSFQDAQASTEP